ncbi:DEAD/DEAH box helicase [Pseudonocardia sp. RS11V-5]|uniref:SNF2-related protein n=1 Tax=Pseudonocardia terrae TaxID=2905831 RepID=UPI001E5D50B3|nr:SNF2-related protein [Pseudonocardia terrae]MCE3554515.1 DEAD/DEAH box helicase [Pseudonocardia terrae]
MPWESERWLIPRSGSLTHPACSRTSVRKPDIQQGGLPVAAAFAAGSTVLVRDEEWVVSSCERAGEGWKLRCTGSSELVRGVTATFYDSLDDVVALDPAEATLVLDDSPRFRRSRLWVESVLRKTPVPLHEPGLTVSADMLLTPLEYQRKAVATALDANRLRPRLLIADAVGLGKTLEIGMILAELARRGRAERVLVVTPRQVLEQMQYELWTRFSLPLVRLDSDGIQRVRQQLPSSRNPFTYFPKVIVSIDTLKSARYRAHLENHKWDAVVIDESHNVTNAAAQRSELARLLAGQTDALILASATPHNGKPDSFAELIGLLDPTAIVDREQYDVKDIEHLFVRRHRHSPDVAREVGRMWAERPEPQVLAVEANPIEDAIATELSTVWLHPGPGGSPMTGGGRQLFSWNLAKAFLSSPAALLETVEARQKTIAANPDAHAEAEALTRLAELAGKTTASAKLDKLVDHLKAIGIAADSDTRVVLFSERLATLDWLRTRLPKLLGLPEEAFAVLHGKLPDKKQMEVVEAFQLATTPVRVLITGDVASEGVNLHKRCHNLVHVDIPWSLIRIEQRNGRIDRYGQQHAPTIVALALTTSDEKFSGDVRVITRLLEKEHAAHQALGDAASLLHLHDTELEESAIRRALQNGTSLDEVIPDPVPTDEFADDDEFADFDTSFLTHGENTAEAPPARAEQQGLFDNEVDFLREAIHEAFDGNPSGPGGVGWAEHPDEGLVELVPPKDLVARLGALPQSYLAQRKIKQKLLLAVTREAGEDHLRRATEGREGEQETQWPLAHFLSPLHPVLDWAVDRALTRLGRNQVPVATAAVDMPTAIVLGTLTNQRGQVVLRSVVGMQFLPSGDPIVLDDAEDVLRSAGFRSDAVNPEIPLDLSEYAGLVPAAVDRMRAHMALLKQQRAAMVTEPLRAAARGIAQWRRASEALADKLDNPRQAERARRRIAEHGDQAQDLVASLSARKEPMVRVLLLLVPNGDPR